MEEKHKGGACQCRSCQIGFDAAMAEQDEMLKKYGWIVHFVMGDKENTPFGANYHTHGLPEKYNHLNLQVVFPLPQEVAHRIFITAVEAIEGGCTFEVGKMYDNILDGYDVQFIDALECGRSVLRMILPDKHGKFDQPPYSKQFEKLLHDLKPTAQA